MNLYILYMMGNIAYTFNVRGVAVSKYHMILFVLPQYSAINSTFTKKILFLFLHFNMVG